ncbi:MAG: hypothetical protein AAF456_11030 [Planctomycetota bacterium]
MFKNKMPSFCWLPAGDRDTASSRLRCWLPHDLMTASGVESHVGEPKPADFVVVQKKVTETVIEFALQAKEAGSRIVYDVDDSGDALWYWAPPKLCFQMLNLADIVTTDTPERAEWLRKPMPRLKTETWFNPVDYGPQETVRQPVQARNELRIFWFGSTSTLSSLRPYAEAIARTPATRLVVCTGDEAPQNLDAEYIPWNRDTFIETLQGCDVTCMMHDGSVYNRMKSNHKMTTSICWGIPAIVSATPDYQRAAEKLGVEEFVFSGPSQLHSAIERLRTPQSRINYLDQAQPRVWEYFSPQASLNRFEEIVGNIDTEDLSPGKVTLPSKARYVRWWMQMAESPLSAIRDFSRRLLP